MTVISAIIACFLCQASSSRKAEKKRHHRPNRHHSLLHLYFPCISQDDLKSSLSSRQTRQAERVNLEEQRLEVCETYRGTLSEFLSLRSSIKLQLTDDDDYEEKVSFPFRFVSLQDSLEDKIVLK